MVKVKGPAGVSTVYTMTGRAIMAPPDRTIEVTEEDAVSLLGNGWTRG
jgi:hypothetical protein